MSSWRKMKGSLPSIDVKFYARIVFVVLPTIHTLSFESSGITREIFFKRDEFLLHTHSHRSIHNFSRCTITISY